MKKIINKKTNHIYERISKKDILSYMQSPKLNQKEQDSLSMSLTNGVDLFKTIRDGKTLLMDAYIAKKHIKKAIESSFRNMLLQMLSFVFLIGLCFFTVPMSIENKLYFIANGIIICLSLILVFNFCRAFVQEKVLQISLEHVNRSQESTMVQVDVEVDEMLV